MGFIDIVGQLKKISSANDVGGKVKAYPLEGFTVDNNQFPQQFIEVETTASVWLIRLETEQTYTFEFRSSQPLGEQTTILKLNRFVTGSGTVNFEDLKES